MRWRTGALLIAGSAILTHPTNIAARCYPIGTPQFRCDPIISESLRRKSLGLPNRYPPKSSPQYRYEGNTFTLPSTGATVHRYTYKDGLGNTYKGEIETFPGGAVRYRGRWR